MALSITTSSNGTDFPSGVIGDLKYKVIELSFDSSYVAGGESLTASDIGFDQIVLAQIEPTDGMKFAYDYTNSTVKAYGTGPMPVQMTDLDAAASEVLVYVHIDSATEGSTDRKIGHFESVNAGNATVGFQATSTNSATGTMWDDNAAATNGTLVFCDEDGDTDLDAAKLLFVSPINEDIYVPMTDGSYLTIYDDNNAATTGIQLYCDDNSTNAYERLLFVAPSNASVNVHTSTTISDRADSAEVQTYANLSLQTNVRAFILGH